MNIVASQTEQEAPYRPQVLVVDDEETILRFASTILSKNFEVITTSSPKDALRILQSTSCQILVTDLKMPEMDGLMLIKEARKVCPEIYAIIMTAYATKNVAIEAIKEHVSDFLEKPFGTELLNRTVEKTYATLRADKMAAETERLRELSEMKSQFVADASHELRTPLSIIREFVSLVNDGIAGTLTDKQKECLRSALRNCDRITELINKMLDLAKIEAGKVNLHRVKADITPILAECHSDFLPKYQSKKQLLLLEVPDDLPAAHCDIDSIREVLTNLLGNAHKFTPENGTIRIGCQHEGKFVCVYVEDNGSGIPPEAQETIFEPFCQILPQNGGGAKGTGLGLTITKNLVLLNGGYISVDSAPGRGSRFSFTLPVYEKEPSYRILLVDDEESAIKTITQMLRSSDLNLEIESTMSGMDSLVIAGRFEPDLVILDVFLAEVEGKQVLVSLKQESPDNSCKILAISGDSNALTEMVKQGADDYLEKPFSSDDLIRKVVSLLGIERRKR